MRKTKPFYGWWALSGAMVVTFVVGGAYMNSFGVFLPVICDQLGWSRAEVSLALSMGIIAFGLPSLLYSYLISKYGARFAIITGNLLAAAGMALLFFVHAIWHLYLLYIFIGAVAGFGGYIACTTIANNWFVKRRSLVMGMITASVGIGGLAYPPLVTTLIKAIGWRGSWLVLAGIVAASVLTAGIMLIRNKPEDIGQVPDGIPASLDLDIKQSALPNGGAPSTWRLTQVIKQPTTYLILAFVIANAFTMGTMSAHQIAYLQDIGFNPMTAATTVSVMAVFSLIGSLLFGILALKINIRYMASTGLLLELTSILILLATKNLTMMFVYAALLGLGTGAMFTAMPTFIGAYYPRERYAQVTGLILPFHVVAQAIAASVAGAIHDITGVYTLAFVILAGCVFVGLFCAFFARPPKLA
jgi:MFS family permease